MVQNALDVGMLVLFAAGNCGTGCVHPATSPCGATDRGPNHSILGPNGHPDVMTVGGADTNGQWYGFTSQGAAVLTPNAPKPDFCSMMQFGGFFPVYGPKPFDGGTSTACATAAGVVALLKSYRPNLTQAQARTALMNTARNIRAPGFDQDSGAGIIRAYSAFGAL
jgi:subtilisin family serine protease